MTIWFACPEKIGLTIVMCFFLFSGVLATEPVADLVLKSGKIWTGGPDPRFMEAVAVIGNRIAFVGSNAEVARWIGDRTRVVELEGRLVLPGFNDAHVHFSDGGFSLIALKLRDARDRNEFARRIGDYAAGLPAGTWITGGNWDHEGWPDKRYPDRWLIDPVAGDHPVLVNRLDGHLAVANSIALKIAGISRETPNPQGGFIEKDPESGEPTGILKDTAVDLVSRFIPPPPDSLREKAILAALEHAASLGVTSVQDVSPLADLPFYQKLRREGRLTCRIYAALPIESHTTVLAAANIEFAFGDPLLRIGAVKCFSDGSMGAGSALFFEPYSDDPTTSGLGIYSKEKLTDLIREADQRNLQIFTHAIGDMANRWVLDAYEEAQRQGGRSDLRHRIEHAQVVTPEDVVRFSQLGIVSSIQPSHCIDDMRWAEKRIGLKRCSNAYRFQSFLKAGVHVAFGTDWPVEELNPLIGIYAAVTREFAEGGPEGGWFPEEKMSLSDALRCYTYESAYAEHQEKDKGSIEVGKLADLIVLDRDLFSIEPKEILQTKVILTIMDGKIVFRCSGEI